MKKGLLLIVLTLITATTLAADRNNKAIAAWLDRIGGSGTHKRITTRLKEDGGQEMFIITSRKGKPCIEGNTMSAVCTGVNWYLNHYAKVNISWNQLTVNLKDVPLPIPEKAEQHRCNANFRYYLNYCTFGYSMATWTWDRWEKEIDWMALHGINMPLQIVGLEPVWKKFLMEYYGYSEDDAESFVPGPAFTAWWGMNNLEGWGGDTDDATKGVHDDAWYDRQASLAKKICDRERELGIMPVLPGFSGMVPSNFQEKTGLQTEEANLWCGFQRPTILDPTKPEFSEAARHYYDCLKEVMGSSNYYSMDPFHEGGTIKSGNYSQGYKAVYDAMNANCGEQSQWVIQQWQWAPYQATSLTAVPEGRLIVLDLFSDGNPAFDKYDGYSPQKTVYCTIPNFGGRTGFMGRLPKMASNYFMFKDKYPSIRGIGAAPEAIESVPVVYDLLFELAWLDTMPDVNKWVEEYSECRYGGSNINAKKAWDDVLQTAMNNTTSLQGPHESVMCGRPALDVNKVSSWGGSTIFYDREKFAQAARTLLDAADEIGTSGSIGAENMCYDLTDMTRQVMSDYSKLLLAEIKEAYETHRMDYYNKKKDQFLQLILDADRLLGTNRLFRLGNWTETARKAAEEIEGATTATADWFEMVNARTLITTWGKRENSERGGLRDYSYRQWEGMLRDFYYPRWDYFFNHKPGELSVPEEGWFDMEWQWAHTPAIYSAAPIGDTRSIAREILTHILDTP